MYPQWLIWLLTKRKKGLFYFKDESVDAVQKNNVHMFWQSYVTHKYIVWGTCRDCNGQFCCTYNSHFSSTGKEVIFIKIPVFFYRGTKTLVGQGLLIMEDSWLHSIRHTTLGRTPLDGWSARRTDLYLTTHSTHNRQTSMPPVGFEPTISVG